MIEKQKYHKVFSFLRGAIRGAFGKEDFSERTFLFVGLNELGYYLLDAICSAPPKKLFFGAGIDRPLRSSLEVLSLFPEASFWKSEPTDIQIDLVKQNLTIKGKTVSFEEMLEGNSFDLGVHTFYLT